MVFAVLEGALQEYHRVASDHSYEYQANHRNVVSHEPHRNGCAWYEIIMMIMQSLWALAVGAIQSIWHTIRTWVELLLIVFECSELVHKLSDRFNLWDGLNWMKIG